MGRKSKLSWIGRGRQVPRSAAVERLGKGQSLENLVSQLASHAGITTRECHWEGFRNPTRLRVARGDGRGSCSEVRERDSLEVLGLPHLLGP